MPLEVKPCEVPIFGSSPADATVAELPPLIGTPSIVPSWKKITIELPRAMVPPLPCRPP